MSLIAATLLVLVAEGPVMVVSAPADDFDIGYEELMANDNAEALEAIEACKTLPADDPARQINHAVALARLGELESARTSFAAAARNADRYELETATGEWVDSRVLARRGLAMLEGGEFRGVGALAVR